MPEVEPPEPTRLGEIVWLQPYPDALLEGAINAPLGPEARYEQTEAISLAFVTALQVLPARQRAVLDLARGAGIPRRRGGRHPRLDRRIGHQCPQAGPAPACSATCRRRARAEAPPVPGSPAEQVAGGQVRPRLPVRRCRRAGRVAHRRCLAVRCHQFPSNGTAATWWPGFVATFFCRGRTYDLVPTRANGQLAFGAYPSHAPPAASATGAGLLASPPPVPASASLTRFDNDVLPWSGCRARSLADRQCDEFYCTPGSTPA